MEFEEDALKEKAEVFKNAGNDAYRKKDFAKAIFFYTEGIKVECKDKELVSQLYNNRSTVYFYQGNYHDCVTDVKAATALRPPYVKAIIRGANACLKLEQFEEAIIWCDKGLDIDPNNQDLLKIKGNSGREREKLESRAGDKAEKTSEGDSRTQSKPLDCTSIAETRKNAGNDAFHEDDFVKAINLYTEGIELKCSDEDLNAKLYNNRALAHYHLGNYHDCLSDIKAATALQPSYLKAIFRGANTCVKLKQFDEAIIWCDKGLAIDPDNQDLLEIKSRSDREHEKLESHGGNKAEKTEEDSRTRSKPLDCASIAETRKNAGNDAFHKDDFVKAINLYTEGIDVKCNDEDLNAKLYNNRALAHYHLENYEDCLSDIKAATALKPNYLKAIIRGAKVCLKLMRFEEAIDWCDQGLAINMKNQELLEIKKCSVVERETLLTLEGGKEAKQEGNSRTNPKPVDCTSIAETHKTAGNDAFLKSDFIKAINLYTEGIEVKCEDEDLNAKLYNNRASAHYHLGNYHDCLSDVKAATALQPSYLKAIIRGADACLKLKQIEEANVWCDKGLTVSCL